MQLCLPKLSIFLNILLDYLSTLKAKKRKKNLGNSFLTCVIQISLPEYKEMQI